MQHRHSYLAGVALGALLISLPADQITGKAIAQVAITASVTVDALRERVASQGDFVTVSTIGQVWKPRGLPQGWQPYTRGDWIYNDKVGWYFNSDEPFAEVTYHYGRWYEDSQNGWVWVADTKWAPAWVEWRRNKQYVGWRPLPPENAPRRARSRGTTVTVTRSRGTPDFVEEEWVFIPADRIVGTRVESVMIQRQKVVEIYSQTEVVGRVEERGGLYVNLALQPTVLQRDSNITIQSRNLPQVAVPVPAQIQQISTESKTTTSPPASASPVGPGAPSPYPAGQSPASAKAPIAPSSQTPAAAARPTVAPTTNVPASATAPATPSGQNPASAAAPAGTPAPKTPAAATPTAPAAQPPAASAPAAAATKPPASATAPAVPGSSNPASSSTPAATTTKPPASAPPASQTPAAAARPAGTPPPKAPATVPADKPPTAAPTPAPKADVREAPATAKPATPTAAPPKSPGPNQKSESEKAPPTKTDTNKKDP